MSFLRWSLHSFGGFSWRELRRGLLLPRSLMRYLLFCLRIVIGWSVFELITIWMWRDGQLNQGLLGISSMVGPVERIVRSSVLSVYGREIMMLLLWRRVEVWLQVICGTWLCVCFSCVVWVGEDMGALGAGCIFSSWNKSSNAYLCFVYSW